MDLRHKIGLELNRHLAKELTKDHPLREIFWECTLRCNLHCRHCGRAFYEMEFPWGMVTNGYALTAEKLRRLKEA